MKKQNVNDKHSRRSSESRDILKIEKAVDRILFENKDKLVPIVDDVGNKRQDCLNPKSYSLDERKKESIYFVKVKKNSDGKKEEHIGKEPTVVKKKDKKIFGTNKKSQEKKSLGMVDSSGKGVSYPEKSIADLPPNEAKWLEKRLHKVTQERGEKSSSSLPLDKNSSQSNKLIEGKERRKIISSFKKTPTESFSNEEGRPTSFDSKKSDFKRFGQNTKRPIEKQLPEISGKDKNVVGENVVSSEDIGGVKTDKVAVKNEGQDESIERQKRDEKLAMADKPVKKEDNEKPSAIGEIVKKGKAETDVASKVKDGKPEDVSSKDEKIVCFSAVPNANSFEGRPEKTMEGGRRDSPEEFSLKVGKSDESAVKDQTQDESSEIKKGIKKDGEPDKKTGRFKKLLQKGYKSKKITDFKGDESKGEQKYPIKTDHAFSKKPKELDASVVMESMHTEGESSTSSKEIKLEKIAPDGQIQFIKEAANLKSVTLNNLGYLKKSYDELDFYPLEEPFAYVEIIRENDTLDKRYVLVEIELTEDEARILKFLEETLGGFSVNTNELDEKGEEGYIIEQMDQIIVDYALKIDGQSKKKIVYFLKKQFLGLGKLEILMKDPNIEDVSCDGSGVPLFLYHRKYGSLKSNVVYDDEEELADFVVKLAQKCGKHISIAEPMLDATMPDGSRLQMTLSTEITTKGSTFTIRKFKEDPFSPPDLIEFNTMSAEMVAYLWLAVENGINALVAGGTAAGKTSTLNAFSLFIPREAKIVSIEETREINLPHPNWIPGVSRSGFGEVVGGKVVGEIDMYDLMKAALRQRPEYILVGEIRGREAYVLFQAMATGHTTYSTVHADSAASLIHRLEGKPINIPRIMLQALDIVCIQVISRIKNKRARRCKQIIEIIDIDPTTKEILTNEVFHWDPIDDTFEYSGKSYILERVRGDKDLSREEMTEEIKRRAQLLDWMNVNNIREFKKVATLIAQYADNPAQLMEKIHDGKLL